jgi:hypothetical protein
VTFRKRPVVIEAIPAEEVLCARDWMALPKWFRDTFEKGGIVITGNRIHISTLEGNMTGEIDDWIICGIKGELYPCKPDIFTATYEAVAVEKSQFEQGTTPNEAKT